MGRAGHREIGRVTSDLAIFDVLRRHRVPFVVVGGHAVFLHGYQRATEDADAVWDRTPESETALLAALVELEAGYIGREIDPATNLERVHPVSLAYVRANHLMMLVTRMGFLDLFDYVPGYPDAAVEQVMEGAVDIQGLRVISVGWLRRMKQAAGRTKDLADLEQLPPAE